jgi:hypothetical protein
MQKKTTISTITLWFILAIIVAANGYYRHWNEYGKPGERGVIKWDVISYYAYLPATFIYGDVTLGFIDNPPENFVNDNKFWYYTMEDGNRVIRTSMGLSILYSPFFFIAHGLAPYFDLEPDGYSSIYQLFLVLSSLFYVMMGLMLLKRILLRFFSQPATAITLLLVALGTNLFFYTIHEGPMAHSYNFALITLFLYLVIKWHEEPSYKRSVLLGFVYGLIVLVRPSNILVGVLFLGWGVRGPGAIRARLLLLAKQYRMLLMVVLFFIIPWIPQMIYWKAVTGNLFYNSYGPSGSNFFLNSPQIFDLLFSFRSGWYIYTPVMFAATVGLFFMKRKCKAGLWPITTLLLMQIYLLSCWWSWWNGGSFGLRSFVDIYGLMALPLAALIDSSLSSKRYVALVTTAVLGFFLYVNQFQTIQYTKGIIHFIGNTKESYGLNFLRFKADGRFWGMLSIPDTELARLGIYYDYHSGENYSEFQTIVTDQGKELIREEIQGDKAVMRQIGRHAKRSEITNEEALEMVVDRVYDHKSSP